MKKLISSLVLVAICTVVGFDAQAQSKENKKQTTIKIKVVEKNDSRTRVIERNYTTDLMSDGEQKAFVDKVLDSLGLDGSGQKQISIIVDSDDEVSQNDQDRHRVIIREKKPNTSHEPMLWRDDNHTFRFDTDEMEGSIHRIEKDMRPRIEVLRKDMERFGDRMGNLWTNDLMQAGSVRGLNAYPNNPNNGVLNLRFNAPEAGDVVITVTDTQGKEVGRKSIKDFSGEFVGQVEIKKNIQGTLFVTVVQNEDGAVRKIALK
jgi:hypothetical protein